jgi:hypothetical protein
VSSPILRAVPSVLRIVLPVVAWCVNLACSSTITTGFDVSAPAQYALEAQCLAHAVARANDDCLVAASACRTDPAGGADVCASTFAACLSFAGSGPPTDPVFDSGHAQRPTGLRECQTRLIDCVAHYGAESAACQSENRACVHEILRSRFQWMCDHIAEDSGNCFVAQANHEQCSAALDRCARGFDTPLIDPAGDSLCPAMLQR